jgi:predicted RNA-binding Zn ribbon-like protein
MSYRSHTPHLIGGRLCLDFVNTADWSQENEVVLERLEQSEDLAIWCRTAGLKYQGQTRPNAQIGALRSFRQQLRQLFIDTLNKEQPSASSIHSLNAVAGNADMGMNILKMEDGVFLFGPDVIIEQAVCMSAISLLTCAQEVPWIRHCPGDNCGWLFLDESRTRRRKWCSMETCGNRAKARRYYNRSLSESR